MRKTLPGILLLALLSACSPARLLTAGLPDAYKTTDDVAYEAGERHRLDIYQPDAPLPGHPVVVFFYGGEWKYGDRGDYGFMGGALASRGITVVIPDYRLYPPTPFPGFVEDGADAVAWTRAHIGEYGGNPDDLFVMGHSAGAYIAAMLALNPAYLARDHMRSADLRGMIGLSGPYNFLPITWPELKPIFEVVPDLSVTQPITYADGKNPPLLLMAGRADDTVNPWQNTDALYKKVLADNGPASERLYDDIEHIGMVTAFAPLFRDRAAALYDAVAFIEANGTEAKGSP